MAIAVKESRITTAYIFPTKPQKRQKILSLTFLSATISHRSNIEHEAINNVFDIFSIHESMLYMKTEVRVVSPEQSNQNSQEST